METLIAFFSSIWDWITSSGNLWAMAIGSGVAILLSLIVVATILAIFGFMLWHIFSLTAFNPAFWVLCAVVIGTYFLVKSPDRSWLKAEVDADFVEACARDFSCRKTLKSLDSLTPQEKDPEAYRPLDSK